MGERVGRLVGRLVVAPLEAAHRTERQVGRRLRAVALWRFGRLWRLGALATLRLWALARAGHLIRETARAAGPNGGAWLALEHPLEALGARVESEAPVELMDAHRKVLPVVREALPVIREALPVVQEATQVAIKAAKVVVVEGAKALTEAQAQMAAEAAEQERRRRAETEAALVEIETMSPVDVNLVALRSVIGQARDYGVDEAVIAESEAALARAVQEQQAVEAERRSAAAREAAELARLERVRAQIRRTLVADMSRYPPNDAELTALRGHILQATDAGVDALIIREAQGFLSRWEEVAAAAAAEREAAEQPLRAELCRARASPDEYDVETIEECIRAATETADIDPALLSEGRRRECEEERGEEE